MSWSCVLRDSELYYGNNVLVCVWILGRLELILIDCVEGNSGGRAALS